MLSRSAANAAVGRASAMRRMRRLTAKTANHLYCATNGCTSFLVVDEASGTATCHICGYKRRVHLH